MRRKLLFEERQPCLKIKITLAIFKLSRNMPCLNYQIDNISQWYILKFTRQPCGQSDNFILFYLHLVRKKATN